MEQEGVIKFKSNWIKTPPPDFQLIKELNDWREKLFEAGLIGENENGVGYGNISIRYKNNFIITGSGTGKFETLTAEHYTLVTEYDLDKNTLTNTGPVIASSESLTHAVIYEHEKKVNAVMHVHHLHLWSKLQEILPSTAKHVEYGTPAMAHEIFRLFQESNLSDQKLFAMAGHEGGIVSFGNSLDEAGEKLFSILTAS